MSVLFLRRNINRKEILMNEKKELFENTPIAKALAAMAIPTIISQLISMIYNMADTIFIGMTDDPYKVAAAGVVGNVFFVMSAFTNLFGVGGGSLMSRLLGISREEEAKRVCSFSFYGSLLIGIICSVVAFLFADPISFLLGASQNTIGYCREYIFWTVFVGGIPMIVSVAMSHLLRSAGYSGKSSFGLALGGVMNIILDPIFMFVVLPSGNEVTGAAIATMFSNVIALLYFLFEFLRLRKKSVLTLSPKLMIPSRASIGSVFAIGLPSTLSAMLAATAAILKNNLASGHSDIELAALSIVVKIDMLPLNIGMGLCQGMMPLVAYNYAAANYKRMNSFIKASQLTGMIMAGTCILAFEIFAEPIVRIFIGDATTIAYGKDFLRIACLATPFMISNFQKNFCLQAMGKGKESLLLAICRQGLVYIPILLVANHFLGIYGVVGSQLVSDMITFVITTIVYGSIYKKLVVEAKATEE